MAGPWHTKTKKIKTKKEKSNIVTNIMCIGLAIVVNGTVISKLAALMALSGENFCQRFKKSLTA